ncbi:MAG: hypothetical protein U0704_09715 [Candidatus Eisenbacteria bacterium]
MQSPWMYRVLSRVAPGLVPGRTLHRRALAAAAAGDAALATAAFAAAAVSYQRAWDVGALARLRVHERMVEARFAADRAREADLLLGIVRSLNKLDLLESLEAPFEPRDAREVLSAWLSRAEAPVAARTEQAA